MVMLMFHRAWLLVPIVMSLASGCTDHCQALEETICADLKEDCAAWRASGLSEKVLPSPGRGRNKACKVLREDGYPRFFEGVRKSVDHQKKFPPKR